VSVGSAQLTLAVPAFTTWVGSPVRALGLRSRRLLELEALVGMPVAS
jgi:hypothetical protein